MRYIALFMLICLFFTVSFENPLDALDNINCLFEKEKDCKDAEQDSASGIKCCWFKGKPKTGGEKEEHCTPVVKKEFDIYLDGLKSVNDDVSLDCSGKYLYVASLLLLFFVF